MDSKRFFSYFSVFFVLIIPEVDVSGIETWENKIYKTYVVEDFETIELNSDHFRVRKYKEDPLPEVWMTSNITAPIPGSRRALLFRFSEETNYPAEFIFPTPIEFTEFLKEMEFPIYSSKSGGSVSIILQTHDYENKKIFLSNLNFRGWRNVKLTVRERLNQNDPVFNSKLVVRFIGFVYEPQSSTPYGSEILVGFDDISATTRKKYRTLPDPASLLE